MKRITSKLLNYPLTPKFSQLRHIKYAQQAKLAAPTRSKSFKKSVAPLTTSKSLKIVKFENVEGIPPKWFEWFFRGLTKSFRVLKKVVFQSASFDYALKAQAYGLKKIMKNIRHLETLSLVYFRASYLKYCRSLKNVKLCVSETTSPTSALSKIRHLKQLERVEVCLSDEDQALNMLKEIHHRVKAPHCWLDITLMKAFWPYCDNIESISHQTFKKVASVELNLAKLSAIPVVDNNTLEAHLKFLKFLFEAGDKSQRRRRNFECLKFPGMKLNIDRKEYDSPPKIYSLLENFLSVYDSSVFHVKEYSPENNLAKLYFELTSWASSWEILELLKDIIEIKDIKFLHLELDVKGMTEREFNNIIENICKIERLQFLYVASGAFSMEVKYPAEKIPAGLVGSGKIMVELKG